MYIGSSFLILYHKDIFNAFRQTVINNPFPREYPHEELKDENA